MKEQLILLTGAQLMEEKRKAYELGKEQGKKELKTYLKREIEELNELGRVVITEANKLKW